MMMNHTADIARTQRSYKHSVFHNIHEALNNLLVDKLSTEEFNVNTLSKDTFINFDNIVILLLLGCVSYCA